MKVFQLLNRLWVALKYVGSQQGRLCPNKNSYNLTVTLFTKHPFLTCDARQQAIFEGGHSTKIGGTIEEQVISLIISSVIFFFLSQQLLEGNATLYGAEKGKILRGQFSVSRVVKQKKSC